MLLSITSNDMLLLHKFQQGDNKALQQIFQQYYKLLVLFANKLINDLPQAEDITAESFYKLYLHRENFDSLPQVKAFLYMVSRNACLNYNKARRRHQHAHQQIAYLSGSATGHNMLDDVHDKQALHAIQEYMQYLPGMCRTIFQLIFYKGKKTHEVAAILGISTKNVTNQKLKAIRLIRAALAKKDLLPTFVILSYLAL